MSGATVDHNNPNTEDIEYDGTVGGDNARHPLETETAPPAIEGDAGFDTFEWKTREAPKAPGGEAKKADDGFGWDDGASLGLDMIPVVGSLKSLGQLITGTDLVTGEPVNRWMEAVGILAGIVPGGKGALKGVMIGAKVLKKGDKAVDATKAAGKVGVKSADDVAEAGAKNPVFEVSKKEYPNHARVIENAEKKGLPTKGLERGAGTKAAQRNRRRAQAEIRKKNGPPPKDYDYDEFPYASSKQGGKGSHVEPVKSTENQAAGRDLGKFYREKGIKEGDKYDVKVKD